MTGRELFALRREAKKEEALAAALDLIALGTDDTFTKNAISWVLYDHMKDLAEQVNDQEFFNYLKMLSDLSLPLEDPLVFDNIAFQIGKLLFALARKDPQDHTLKDRIFPLIKEMPLSRPSKSFSFLLKAFIKGHKTWVHFPEFVRWWGLKNLMEEDYLPEEFNDRKLSSLAEQVYVAYAAALVERAEEEIRMNIPPDLSYMDAFLPDLDEIIDKHPDYTYPAYYKTKILLLKGANKEDKLEDLLPFARKKQGEFWVWELLGQVFDNDPEMKFSCYCKALSLKTRDDFLVKIRARFIPMLLDRELYSEARTELDRYLSTREKKNWKIPPHILSWKNASWYASSTRLPDNKALYLLHKGRAETLLYKDTPVSCILVTHVNREKKAIHFIQNEKVHGYFHFEGDPDSIHKNDLLLVRFVGKPHKQRYDIATLEPAPEGTKSEAVRSFTGPFKKNPTQNFGFANGVFIGPEVIMEHAPYPDETITGTAGLSWDTKKKKWAWRAITLIT